MFFTTTLNSFLNFHLCLCHLLSIEEAFGTQLLWVFFEIIKDFYGKLDTNWHLITSSVIKQLLEINLATVALNTQNGSLIMLFLSFHFITLYHYKGIFV